MQAHFLLLHCHHLDSSSNAEKAQEESFKKKLALFIFHQHNLFLRHIFQSQFLHNSQFQSFFFYCSKKKKSPPKFLLKKSCMNISAYIYVVKHLCHGQLEGEQRNTASSLLCTKDVIVTPQKKQIHIMRSCTLLSRKKQIIYPWQNTFVNRSTFREKEKLS